MMSSNVGLQLFAQLEYPRFLDSRMIFWEWCAAVIGP